MTGRSVRLSGFSFSGRACVGRALLARSSWAALAAVAAFAGSASVSRAQDAAPYTEAASTASAAASFWNIFSESTPTLNLRTKVEYSDQKFKVPGVVDIDPGVAYTARARAGLRTGEYKGFQGAFEYEVNKQLGPKRYNAAGVEGPQDKSGIGDPESARFSQAYIKYSLPFADFTVGRQKFSLGNGIWLGTNDFRNNGINYDALTTTIRPLENLELFYGYIYNIQTIFGSRGDSKNDFDSRSNVVQATYKFTDFFKLKGYGFLLDVERQHKDANSTNTYGVIATGEYTVPSTPLGPLRLDYNAELATQTDAADSPRDYRANYVKGEVGVASPVGVRLGVGRQIFGEDNGIGFADTIDPQVIRDVFLAVPANGLVDSYASIGGALPLGFLADLQYHKYHSKNGTDDYGQEVQLLAQRPINKRLAFVLRVDNYRNADPGPATNMFPAFPSDTFRYSLQLDFKLN